MKKKISLFNKILGFLIKKGKKTKAKYILVKTFLKISTFFKKPLTFILNKLYLIMNVFVETKTIKVKRSRYIVPFPINLKRRIYLITKWIILSVNTQTSKNNFSEKLFLEMYSLLKGLKTKSILLKNLNNSKALLNRSNLHYRW